MQNSFIQRDLHHQQFDNTTKDINPIFGIFNGCYQNISHCKSCNSASFTFHNSMDLFVDTRGVNSVNNASDLNFADDILDGVICEQCQTENRNYSSKNQDQSTSTKKSIDKAPRALCIRLQRFVFFLFYHHPNHKVCIFMYLLFRHQ